MLIRTTAIAAVLASAACVQASVIIFPPSDDGLFARDDSLEPHAGRVISACTKSKTFALTFDDGPYSNGREIAAQVKASKGLATFFLTGNNDAGCIYDHAEDIVELHAQGHLLGVHSWSHVDITTLSVGELHQQLDLMEEFFAKVLSVRPTFFRPPYGKVDEDSLNVLGSRGYDIVLWSGDSGDAMGASVDQSIATYDAIIKRGRPALVKNHETVSTTESDVLPAVLPRILKKGYKLTTVAQCVGDKSPYVKIGTGKPGKRDTSWTCAGKPGPGQA